MILIGTSRSCRLVCAVYVEKADDDIIRIVSARKATRAERGGTKKASSESRRRKEPAAESLREMPRIDFSRYRVRKNPYARRIAREGIELVHDEPSRESLAAIPEADLASARARPNPWASRAAEAVARMQRGKGRPPRGRELGPTPTRSIRLPQPIWDALEAEAKAAGTTVHALLREAVTTYLLERTGRGQRRS
jgi:hypothetical protein